MYSHLNTFITLSYAGMVVVIPSSLRSEKKHLDDATLMSLWQHYLVLEGPLKEMHEAFMESHPDEEGIFGAHGVEGKKEAKDRFDEWVRAQPMFKGQMEYMYIEPTAARYRRCVIGPLELREASLDENCDRSLSYYLAEVGDGKVQVCRATGFICHRPPGVGMDRKGYKDYKIFVVPEWLIPATPLLTTKSKLPLVAMPDAPKWIKSDLHAADGLLTRVWPVSSIRPTQVCGKWQSTKFIKKKRDQLVSANEQYVRLY
jgi:hypothetical protein